MNDLAELQIVVDSKSARDAGKDLDNLTDKGRKAEKEIGQLGTTAKGLGASFLQAVGPLRAFLGLLSSVASGFLIRGLIAVGSQFEQLRNRMVTIEGNAAAGARAFKMIEDFSAKSSFELAKLVEAYIMLGSVGIKGTERMIQGFGEIAAATGRDIVHFTQAAVSAAFGNTQALQTFGILARSEGDKLRISFKDTTFTVRKNADEIINALSELGHTEFAGGMERQGRTFADALAWISDAWAMLVDRIMNGMGILTFLADRLRDVRMVINFFAENIRLTHSLVAAFGTALGLLATYYVPTVIRAFTVATAAMWKLTIAILANPFGALALVITGTVAALVYFKDTVIEIGGQTFRLIDLLSALWDEGMKGLKDFWEILKQAWGWFVGTLKSIWGFVKPILEGIWNAIKFVINKITALIVGIVDSIKFVFRAIHAEIALLVEKLPKALGGGGGNKEQIAFLEAEAERAAGVAKQMFQAPFGRDFVGEGGQLALQGFSVVRQQFLMEFGMVLANASAKYQQHLDEVAKANEEAVVDQSVKLMRMASEFAEATKQMREQNEVLKLQAEGRTEAAKQLQKELEFRKITEDVIKKLNRELLPEEIEQLRQLTSDMEEYTEQIEKMNEQKQAQASFTAHLQQMRDEIHLLKMSVDEREKEKVLIQARREIEKAYAGDIDKATQALQDFMTLMDELFELREKEKVAESVTESMLKDLEVELRLLKETELEKKIYSQVTAFQKAAEKEFGDEVNKVADAVKEYETRLRELERAKAEAAFDEMLDTTREELRLLFLSNEEREKQIELIRARKILEEGGVDPGSPEFQQKMQSFEELQQVILWAQKLKEIADEIGQSFGRAFEDVLFGAKTAKEAFRDLYEEIIRLIIRKMVTEQIANMVSGAFMKGFGSMFGLTGSAHGNVFSHGNLVPFARGGIIDRTTLFPLSNNKMGVAGEAGPEVAIAPLKRTKSGNLGVEVEGAGGASINISNTFISDRPSEEFRSSSFQVAERINRSVSRLRGRM